MFQTTVRVARFHRFRDLMDVSSFGPGVFNLYDHTLQLQLNGAGNRIRVLDPTQNMPILLDDGNFGDTKDGIYYDGINPYDLIHTVRDLRLFDGANGSGNLTPDITLAKSAVLNLLDSRQERFEIIDLGPAVGQPVVGADVWRSQDIGTTGFGGGASIANGQMTIGGSGADMWSSADACQFAYQSLRGDGSVTMQLDSFQPYQAWSKTGVMIRKDLTPGSPDAYLVLSDTHGLQFASRASQGGGYNGIWDGSYGLNNNVEPRVAKVDPASIPAANTDMTEAFWIRLDQGFNGNWRTLMHKGNNTNERSFIIQMRPDSNKLHCRFSTLKNWNEGIDASVNALTVGTWTHVCVAKQGNKVTLYLNGTLDSSATLSTEVVSNDGPLYIGKDPWFGGVACGLDDLRLYARALTTAEITTLAQPGGTEPVISQIGLVANWRFNENGGSTVADSSANGQTGTFSGSTTMPTWTTGVYGSAIAVDGTSWVQVASSPALSALCDDPNLVRMTKVTYPVWLRLTRAGSTITGSASLDGSYWSSIGSLAIPSLPTDAFIGLCITSHQTGSRAQSVSSIPVLTGTPTPQGAWPPTGVINDRRGRLTSIVDRNGYAINLSYRYNPVGNPATTADQQAAIAVSPDLQWELAQVADPQGNVLTYSYLPTQVSGRWVVSAITVPNGSTIQYQYDQSRLVGIIYPDQTTSSFAVSVDPTSNLTRVDFRDASASGTHRNKSVLLTNNFNSITYGGYVSIYNQSSLLAAYVINGDGEPTYARIQSPTSTLEYYIYEKGTLRYQTSSWNRYFLSGWTIGADGTVTGQMEYSPQSQDFGGQNDNFIKGTPVGYHTADGDYEKYTYDADQYVTSITHSDGTTETYAYNALKQITRQKDRQGRVTQNTFDAQGNLLSVETGILDVGGTNQATADYAKVSYSYFPAGDPNAGLRSAMVDAMGNETDYVYDAQHHLLQVIEPADVANGPRPLTVSAYDTVGRLQSVTNPLRQTVTFAYDARDRVSRVTYADSSHDDITYGTGIEANLIKTRRDRNGVLTTYTYDQTGRTISVVTGDAVSRRTETRTYQPGTELIATQTVNGSTTTRVYDYRNRQKATLMAPSATAPVQIQSQWMVLDDQWCSVDQYGRATFHLYDTYQREIRTIRELIPNGTGAAPTSSGLSQDIAYLIRSVDSGMTMDVSGASSAAGASIIQWPVSANNNQRWRCLPNSDGSWCLQVQHDKQVLNVASNAQGSVVTQNVADGRQSERFLIQPVGDGSFTIASVTSGLVLQSQGGSAGKGTTVIQTAAAGAAFQQWLFIPVASGLQMAALVRVTTGNPRYAIEDMAYNSIGQIVARIDANGITSSYTYDSRGRLITEVQADKNGTAILPEGTQTTFQYNA